MNVIKYQLLFVDSNTFVMLIHTDILLGRLSLFLENEMIFFDLTILTNFLPHFWLQLCLIQISKYKGV